MLKWFIMAFVAVTGIGAYLYFRPGGATDTQGVDGDTRPAPPDNGPQPPPNPTPPPTPPAANARIIKKGTQDVASPRGYKVLAKYSGKTVFLPDGKPLAQTTVAGKTLGFLTGNFVEIELAGQRYNAYEFQPVEPSYVNPASWYAPLYYIPKANATVTA